jgi:hypothetical protein
MAADLKGWAAILHAVEQHAPICETASTEATHAHNVLTEHLSQVGVVTSDSYASEEFRTTLADATQVADEIADRLRTAAEQMRRYVDSPPSAVPPPYREADDHAVPPYGQSGGKTTGRLAFAGRVRDLVSGYNGPAKDLPRPRPGMHNRIASHVEAHAAALMRQQAVEAATLYINRRPCPTLSPNSPGCEDMLPKMLPERARLTVWGPDGYGASFIGTAD